MAAGEQIEGLLADLQTITDTARAGVISKHDQVLESGDTRPAAVLFVDIVGFTPLARKLHSEVLTQVVDRTFRIFELTVRAHGGYCDKVMGDAALYVFAGHPNYAPVCEAALKAALKLQDRLSQINESLGETEVRLAVRQGVAFGEVTRQAVGAEKAQLTVMGETVNQAQRLQATALPDSIQTTVRVMEKAGDTFTSKKLGQVKLKGIGEVTTYCVTGVEEQPVQLRGAFRQLSPLTGREMELEQAAGQIKAWLETSYPPETWDIIQTSAPLKERNRLLIVRGVPAVGKSRLAYEIAERMKTELGAAVATAHCAENAMLAQFTAELARVAGLTVENLPQRWEELCANAALAVSPEYAERQRQSLRLLAYVLGCKTIDASAIGQADPKSFAIGCQLAIRACCELSAHEGKPVLLVIEDLQWLGGFRDVLADVLARACLPWPLLVIATARPEYIHEPGSHEEGASSAIELGALSREQGDALVLALLPGLELPDAAASELHEKAAGIPYFYEDFVRMLVRKKLVAEQDGRWQLTRDLVELDIPDDLQTLMLGRLDQLDAEVRELARRASVLGRTFQRDLLAAIEKRLGFIHEGHPDDDLQTMLAENVLSAEPGDRYFFEHALLRQAAYGSLLRLNRKLLHRMAAEVLVQNLIEGSAQEMMMLESIVVHLAGAEDYLEGHKRSCNLAWKYFHYGKFEQADVEEHRALRFWEKLLCFDPQLPEKSPRLLLVRSSMAYKQGRIDEAISCVQTALQLSEVRGWKDIELSCHRWLGVIRKGEGLDQQAKHHYRIALALARELDDPRSEASLLRSMTSIFVHSQQYASALRLLKEAAALDSSLRSQYATLVDTGWILRCQNEWQSAETSYREAIDLSRSIGDVYGEGIAILNLGEALAGQARYDEALQCQQNALELYRQLGDRRSEAAEMGYLGKAYLDCGQLDDAAQTLNQSLQLLSDAGDLYFQALVYCFLVYHSLAVLDLNTALEHLKEAEQRSKAVRCGRNSSVAKELVKARDAIISFSREHSLEAEVADVIADHEREQAELARDQTEGDG